MIAINEYVMEAALHFPLHAVVFYLLAAWGLNITQIMPNIWSYISATMTLLGQAKLFRLPTPVKINYWMYPITYVGG